MNMVQKHIKAISGSPILAPYVNGYFYNVAKVADMKLKRAMSANPIPSFPTQDMIDAQEEYSIKLGKDLHIEKIDTLNFIEWADEYNSTRSGTDGVEGLAVAVQNYFIG